MAIGSRYNPGSVPNYIQMGEQSERAALQNAQGAANLFNTGMTTMNSIEDRARLDEARQAFDAAWMSKDPDDIQRVIARFPEYAAKIQQSIGVRDDQQRQQVGSMAIQLQGMLDSGNIKGAQEIVRQNARLFPAQGGFSAENVAGNIGIAAQDPKKLTEMKDWAQKLSLSTLSPKEIMSHGLSQQQMAQQLEMQNNALRQQLEIANQNRNFRYQQMNTMADFRNTSPTQRVYEWFSTLSPEDQKVARSLMPGGALGGGRGGMPGGMQKAQLADGRTVDIFPKVHKQGSTAFYQGVDADGSLINVPVDSVVSAAGSGHEATEGMTSTDLETLKNATSAELGPMTGVVLGGSLGEMPVGADIATGYSGAGREAYSAAKRLQGRMQNQGIGAAREMGASGINTVAEAKMFFQSMPQLDFSNEQSLKASVDRIETYVNTVNKKHGINLGSEKSSNATELSDEELLSGL